MAHIEDRWFQPKRDALGKLIVDGRGKPVMEPTDRHRKGNRYRVRYVDPRGQERSRSFPDGKKRAADAFLVEVESDKLRGSYVDPKAGRISFKEYADAWLADQTFNESTREGMEMRLRVHAYPHFGHRELSAIQPAMIRSWDRSLQQAGVASSYRKILFAHVSGIMNAAVDDERITKNPFSARTVRKPSGEQSRIVPWTRERVAAVRAALPRRYQVVADIGAGCGLRQGEVFGLAVEDVDFLGGWVHVRRQLKVVRGALVFALPKGGKTRDVPLPDSVALALAAHLESRNFPSAPVTLPWDVPAGDPVTAELVVTTSRGTAVNRKSWAPSVWHESLKRAGVLVERVNGMHALRHFYASVLLDAGESIKALSSYLGHADAGFTLRTYTHLMPSSEARTRKAIDDVLRAAPSNKESDSDGPATAQGAS